LLKEEKPMAGDLPFTPLLGLGTLVFTLVNFLKFVSGRDWNAALTQAIAWFSGVVAVVLVAHTDFGDAIAVGGHTLNTLNWASQFFIGLMAASLLSTLNEFKKAFDHTDSASTPALLPNLSKAEPVSDLPVTRPTRRPRKAAP
jgi:hypothetical protein